MSWLSSFVCTQLNSYQKLTILFQVSLFNISKSIYQVFLYNTNYLHTAVWLQITNNNNPQ